MIEKPTPWPYSATGSVRPAVAQPLDGRKAVRALARIPAVVAVALDEVDFLEPVLAHVADPQVARLAVEAPAPGIAEAERVDFRAVLDAGAVHVAERVCGEWIAIRTAGDAVGCAARARVHVDAQHLAEQRARVLPVAVRVAGTAAVAEPEVEEPVRPEGQVAAIVVGGGLHDRQEVALGRGIERLPAVHARELRGDGTDLPADQLAEVEVDAPVRREVRVKGHPEEPRFAVHVHARAQVHEIRGRRRRGVVRERADPAALLDHEPARAVVRRLLHRDRRCERQARKCARRCNAVGGAGGYRRRHAAAVRRLHRRRGARSNNRQARGCVASWQLPSVVRP